MKTWSHRPREEAYLINPPFCCTTLVAAIDGFTSIRKEPVPLPLMFMVLPIVLHRATRDALPPNIRTPMAAWLLEHSSERVLFYERLISLKPHTKEAIQFGMLLNWFISEKEGLLRTTMSKSDINGVIRKLKDEARECVMRARFLGKWFGTVGSTHTVMAFWGIRP